MGKRYKVTIELRPLVGGLDRRIAKRQVLQAVREKFPGLCPRVVEAEDA
ncbi:MAG: hypothetical protein QFX35_03355 [Candidatus Verstraetearchaeota archaeon]|nr:hypothetical protein [Candidatus Verstraetearchaeota archaeon]